MPVSSILLGVNVDHVATLRQARGTLYPDPVMAALIAEQSGADSITVHLREDRRHIQERDLELLARTLQTRMNLEMAVNDHVMRIAERLRPPDCCLVPERREELTTEGGLDVAGDLARIRAACDRLAAVGNSCGAVHRPRARSRSRPASRPVSASWNCIPVATPMPRTMRTRARELERVRQAARHAARLGIEVHAGHGLNYHNVQPVAAIAEIVELNIGHAIVAQALFDGLRQGGRRHEAPDARGPRSELQ